MDESIAAPPLSNQISFPRLADSPWA